MLKLSIITINYNNANGLEKTIRSVVGQSFSDFEYIVIDGGSSDSSVEIIKKHAAKINYWVSEKDKGIYNAQNKGIFVAKGEYCLFLNSGDCLSGNDILTKVFSKPSLADILYGDIQTVDNDQLVKHLKMPDHIGIVQLYRDTIWHPASFIKRDLFIRYGNYDEQYKIVADYDFFVKMVIKEKVTTLHIPLEIAIFDTTGISSDSNKKKQLMEERNKVQDIYFNPILLSLFRLYSKLRN